MLCVSYTTHCMYYIHTWCASFAAGVAAVPPPSPGASGADYVLVASSTRADPEVGVDRLLSVSPDKSPGGLPRLGGLWPGPAEGRGATHSYMGS